MTTKKTRILPPRVKRMKRSARLQSARSWLPTYTGKNVVAGYRKHFAVDWTCALKELEMIGIKIDPTYKKRLLTTVANRIEARRRREVAKAAAQTLVDQDENFAYIAGYTGAGFAYGVTWEEWEQHERSSIDLDDVFTDLDHDDLQDIPF